MMKFKDKLTIACLIATITLGLSLFASRVQAQNNDAIADESNIPLDGQARFLRGLESRSSEFWDFSIGEGSLTDDSYQLQMSTTDVRLVEQNPSPWRNTGTGTDYTILVDIYQDRNNNEAN